MWSGWLSLFLPEGTNFSLLSTNDSVSLTLWPSNQQMNERLKSLVITDTAKVMWWPLPAAIAERATWRRGLSHTSIFSYSITCVCFGWWSVFSTADSITRPGLYFHCQLKYRCVDKIKWALKFCSARVEALQQCSFGLIVRKQATKTMLLVCFCLCCVGKVTNLANRATGAELLKEFYKIILLQLNMC